MDSAITSALVEYGPFGVIALVLLVLGVALIRRGFEFRVPSKKKKLNG